MRFFHDSPAAQFVCTGDGSIIECNGMFAGMLGFGTVEAAREYAILPAELTVAEDSGTMGRLESDGIVEARRLDLTHRDGGLVRVMASGRIFSVRLGRVTEVHWTAIPIPAG